MRDRRRELRWLAGTAFGLLALLLLPFEFFDVIAVAMAAWWLWWSWTTPPRRIRTGAGLFPWAPVAFGLAGTIVAILMARALDRPGFFLATVLIGLGAVVGLVRTALPVRSDEG